MSTKAKANGGARDASAMTVDNYDAKLAAGKLDKKDKRDT